MGNRLGPHVHPVLYLRLTLPDASPKAISGRTSYLPVRLAFHPYPQLIPSFCNRNGFGPPPAVRRVSPWPWVAHQVSCLISATRALFRLAFAPAPAVTALASPRLSTRRLILQKAHGHPTMGAPIVCQRTVSGSISLPSPGFFSPFPHGTCTLSVARGI